MSRFLRSLLIVILVLGLSLGLWKAFDGDVGSFLTVIGSLLYQAITAVGDFFANVIHSIGF
jgi:hypothetical protein